jgi:hypothetical protein
MEAGSIDWHCLSIYLAAQQRTAKDFAGGVLNGRQGAARNYQRGSRNPRPPEALAFRLRYSA